MAILILDDRAKERIEKIIDYAHRHPLSMDDMLDIMNKAQEPPGNNPEHVTIIGNVKCVYSEEQQNVGLCKHLSISVNNPGSLPNPEIVKQILLLFNIHTKLEECMVDLEEFAPGHQAVNIVELPKL